MNVLFVCRWNRFRSKVGEAYFRHHVKGKAEVRSVGVSDHQPHYMTKLSIELLNEQGVEPGDAKARQITKKDIEWAEKIIVVADDVPKEIFPEEKSEFWDVNDVDDDDKEGIKRVMGEIDLKVLDLIKRLNL